MLKDLVGELTLKCGPVFTAFLLTHPDLPQEDGRPPHWTGEWLDKFTAGTQYQYKSENLNEQRKINRARGSLILGVFLRSRKKPSFSRILNSNQLFQKLVKAGRENDYWRDLTGRTLVRTLRWNPLFGGAASSKFDEISGIARGLKALGSQLHDQDYAGQLPLNQLVGILQESGCCDRAVKNILDIIVDGFDTLYFRSINVGQV